MSFKRKIQPDSYVTGDQLTSDLVGIGFRLYGNANRSANIENTLLAGSIEGLKGDYRILALLVDWMMIHFERVIADRLIKLILEADSEDRESIKIFWCAIAQMLHWDSRFKSLRNLFKKKRFAILSEQTDYLISRHGEDPRFAKTCLKVPNRFLRHRPEDILSPSELAERHKFYRYRVLIGASFRSDLFAQLEMDPKTNAFQLAKACYASYRTAWSVLRDYRILTDTLAFPRQETGR